MTELFQNSDFFFVVESFKIFFEKVLTKVSDPKGIAIQEWLKYKDKLTAKDATPSSIYCYAHQLIISESQQEGENLIKLKRQSSRRNSKKVITPRKITRRNSFGSESPSNKNNSEGQALQNIELAGHGVQSQNNPQANAANQAGHTGTGVNGGGFSEKINQQYSPWIESDRKKNPSPAKRITTNEIKYIKGLDELSKISKDTKVNEKFEATKKLLLEKVKKCVEQFQKDSTSLDLINERSFQTQTMLIDKSKPFQRQQIKRQDSKFIREFSIYKKNNPTAGQPNTAPVSREQTNQQYKDILTNQNQIGQQITSAAAGGIPLSAPSSGTNALLGQFDFIKSKNNQDFQTGAGLGGIGSVGMTSTQPNYLGQKTTQNPYQANTGLYMPQHKSTNSAGTAALLGTGNVDDKNKQGIDDIVSRILKEQKVKEEDKYGNTKKYEQDKMVQDILIPSYTPSTATNTPYTTSGITSTTTPSYNYATSLTSSNNSTPYSTLTPIKGGLTSINQVTTGNYANTYGISSLQSSQK